MSSPIPTYKVIMIGNMGVGKTFLVNRFLNKSLNENILPTISVEFADKFVDLPNGRQVKVEIWDTGKFRSIYFSQKLVGRDPYIIYMMYTTYTYQLICINMS